MSLFIQHFLTGKLRLLPFLCLIINVCANQNQIEKLEEQDVSDLKLALAQIYLNQEHVYKACDVLRTLGEDAYTPGIVRDFSLDLPSSYDLICIGCIHE